MLLSGTPGSFRIFATSSSQILVKTNKVLPSERGTPVIVPYGKSGPGYYVTIIKRLDEGQRLQRLERNP